MDTNALQPNLTTYELSAQLQCEQLAFVEHICGVMIESRSDVEDPPRPWRVFDGDVEDMFSKDSVFELMPDWAFEFMPGEFVFSRFVLGSARPGAENAGFVGPIQQEWLVAFGRSPVGSFALSPSTLGRGSPRSFGTQRENHLRQRVASSGTRIHCGSPHEVRAF